MAKFLPFQDATQMLLPHETLDTDHRSLWPWKRWFGKEESLNPRPEEQTPAPRSNIARRISRKAIPSLPRPGTFKRQQSELRHNLEAVKSKPNERRAFSVDPHRADQLRDSPKTSTLSLPRTSAPTLMGMAVDDANFTAKEQQTIPETAEHEVPADDIYDNPAPPSIVRSDDLLEEELERKWILNLSMHFRDRSNREKFFVTYAETPTHWRRVTISLDYREAPLNSLEEELQQTQYQRDKSAKIYEAIRESLPDIQFYDTVTNLKLQTESERLHVHVTEDIHEVIHFPPVTAINHLYCRRIREQDLVFDSHLSGFVYKVTVNGHVFIKKEIPGPDTVEEFLYEVNALHRLSGSDSVIQFGGVITNNEGTHLKGLLISFAEKGALIDVIYDGKGELSWPRRERWAKQIVQGLSEIHEAGFVQGDFTLSNIVIDGEDNAKIIDINRRGCPVGWEPPEVAALIESKQRISMYIGVKSDIFQLGMVLWALAMQQDEPEIQPRPLTLGSAPHEIPSYYRALVGICLSEDPRTRCHTTSLLGMFPEMENDKSGRGYANQPSSDHAEAQYIDPANAVERDDIDNFRLMDSQTTERAGLAPSTATHTYVNAPTDMSGEPYFFPRRGRSPPRSATEERELRAVEHYPDAANTGTEWIGDSVAAECEPRIVNVSPGRHYLEEDTARELVPTNVINNVSAPTDLIDNEDAASVIEAEENHNKTAMEDKDNIAGGEATEESHTEIAIENDQHTLRSSSGDVINTAEDLPEDTKHIDSGAMDMTSPPRYESDDSGNATIIVANEDTSYINNNAINSNVNAIRSGSEDVVDTVSMNEDAHCFHGSTAVDSSAISADFDKFQKATTTITNEDKSYFGGNAIEGKTAAVESGGEGAQKDTTIPTSVYVDESTIGGNITDAGCRCDDIVATGDMNECKHHIAEYVMEDSTNIPANGTEHTRNETTGDCDGYANTTTENTITDNSIIPGEVSNVVGDIITKDSIIPQEVIEQAIVPSDEGTKRDEVAMEELVTLGLGNQIADGAVEASAATPPGGDKIWEGDGATETTEGKSNKSEQMEAAVGDLAGIGGHSTLEHSEIPQGISDDDLMNETR